MTEESDLEPGDETDGPNEEEQEAPETDATSQRRIEANRKNARKSTGPRTPEGKAKSSRNATTHGAFVARLAPISQGAFKEDPEEFVAQVQALLDSLEPRDALERAIAIRISGLFINTERLERWSTTTYVGASNSDELDEIAAAGQTAYAASRTASGLAEYLESDPPTKEWNYELFANFVKAFGPRPGLKIKDLWDDEHTPETEAQWQSALETLVKHSWATRDEAAAWAYRFSWEKTRKSELASIRVEHSAASRILNGPLDLHLKYFSRIRRELTELLKVYEQLQQRPLPPPRKNEPNGNEPTQN